MTTSTQPMQGFRCRSTERVVHIPTFEDPENGGRIVLWSDIKAGFKNAESIWKETSLVLPLKNKRFEQ
jgi:hypothetical protein